MSAVFWFLWRSAALCKLHSSGDWKWVSN
jgi:hypothetical protein